MTKTYAQLTREIQALQAHADKLRHSEKQGVIAKLNASIAAYDLRPEDLRFAGSATASPKSSRRTASAGDAKYSDGQGNVWGGRGPRPAWLRAAMTQGRSLESFAATSKTTRSAVSQPTSGPAKVLPPPLYEHPKNGQTWSGRGPQPDWLKQALKKRGASIDDFRISNRESTSSSAAGETLQTSITQKTSSGGRTSPGKRGNAVQTKAVGKRTPKSLAQKIGERTRNDATTQATPTATSTGPTTASFKKTAADKFIRKTVAISPSSNPQRTVKKATGGSAPDPADDRAAPSEAKVPAKKAVVATGAQGKQDRKTAKPSAKKTAPARKHLPTSMAPPSVSPAPPALALSTEHIAVPVLPAEPDTASIAETNAAT